VSLSDLRKVGDSLTAAQAAIDHTLTGPGAYRLEQKSHLPLVLTIARGELRNQMALALPAKASAHQVEYGLPNGDRQ